MRWGGGGGGGGAGGGGGGGVEVGTLCQLSFFRAKQECVKVRR